MRKKPWVKVSLIVVIVLVLLNLAGRVYWYFDSRVYYQEKFDRSVWLAQTGLWKPRNPRGPMAGDVAKTVIRPGMTKSEVVRILGVPDYRKLTGRYDYRIGIWAGDPLCSDILSVRFDANGKVIEARVQDD